MTQVQFSSVLFFFSFFHFHLFLSVRMLLWFIKLILGNGYVPGVSSCQQTSDNNLGVAGSSPFTLTTSLAIPIPSSSSSNGPSNLGRWQPGASPGGSVFGQVQSSFGLIGEGPELWKDFLGTEVPKNCKILHLSRPSKSKPHLFF